MKMTLERRIILFSFIILFLTILANTGMDIAGFRRDYVNALVLRSQSLGASMKGSVEKVLGLGLDLKDLPDISEKCRELVQGNPEIAYCIIADLDGNTLFANDPFYKSLRTNRINASFSMSDNRQVNIIGGGVRFYDSATPVMSPDGKIVAQVHVGFPEKMVTDKVGTMVVRSVIILLIFFLLAFSLVVFFVKKGIMQPISALLNGVKKISEGSFSTNIEKLPVYEFNKLADTINFMAQSLKSREDEIQNNYQELENAHNDLHDSYLKLESLSMELEKSEELYKSLMEDSSDAIIVIGGADLERSAADLARLNKMKDSFLGLASHELKTPLTVIMGYAELISTDMADKLDKTLLEMVQNISNAAIRLDNIVKDMVDVSMIDQKKLQLRLEDVNLNRLVEDSVNELRFFFSMRKQDLAINLDESIPTIKGDNLRLMQLLSNVLGNAIKFTPDGGKITISTGAKYLLRSKQPEFAGQEQPLVNIGKERHMYVEVAISDTGIGIDREDQLRIFDKFYEVGNIEEHSSGKTAFKAKGAGLGLAIAKGIVEMHSGEIWVESQGYDAIHYTGSTFHVLLPLDPFIGDATLDYMNLLK